MASTPPRLSADRCWRWDGQQWVPAPEAASALHPAWPIQTQIDFMTARGWRVMTQTETTAQLLYPKEFSAGWAIFWFFFGCGIGLAIYFFYWLGKREGQVYLTERSSDRPSPC